MSAVPLGELLLLARRLAADAAAFLLDGQHRPRTALESKSTPTDLVSEMDRGAEARIVGGLVAARPGDGIIGEEGTDRPSSSGVVWAVDPLDGTVNYLYGWPLWAVSIGAADADGPCVGVVEVPALSETYWAVRGGGAWLADRLGTRRLAVSATDALPFAMVGSGFAYSPDTRREQAAAAGLVLPAVRDLRRGGAAAVDLCFVAAGRLDAYFERGTHVWDRAAGEVIIAEAGGRTSDLSGSARPSDGLSVASNGRLHDALLALLRDAGA